MEFFKRILFLALRVLARGILRRHKPVVIAVVGSVGKTSAKEAIYQVLRRHFNVRAASDSSYNNEIGVPLTIIGARTHGKNLLAWAGVFLKSLAMMILWPRYPNVLVIEFGEQKSGDISYLSKLAPPSIAVITSVAKVHTEYFKTLAGVEKELSAVLKYMPRGSSVIVNNDDERASRLAIRDSMTAVRIGFSERSDIRAEGVAVTRSGDAIGLSMKVLYRETTVPMFLPGVVARHQAYAVLVACAVGLRMGLNLVEIGQSLRSYRQPKGRTNLIPGKNASVLIDDTYNSSPVSSIAGLKVFDEIGRLYAGKKIAVFGDMLELGDYEADGHREVGDAAAQTGLDLLVTVGERAKLIATAAREAGMPEEDIRAFDSQTEAVSFLAARLKKDAVVLIKGSQTGVRMERVVEALMAHPEAAKKLLVRQDSRWRRKQ